MLLVVDVGNSNTVIGAYRDRSLLAQWRIRTESRITKDELLAKLTACRMFDGLADEPVEALALATVVPDLQITWQMVSRKLTGKDAHRVSAASNTGLVFKYPRPHELGADRIANAVGAVDRYGCPVIVVDFGTATNIDVINREGAYCGGTISPGVDLSVRALFERAAKLQTVTLEAPKNVIGQSTADALRSGILYGAASQAEGLVTRILEELGEKRSDCTIVATGGIATLITKFSDMFDVLDPDLTIHGLQLIAHRSCLDS